MSYSDPVSLKEEICVLIAEDIHTYLKQNLSLTFCNHSYRNINCTYIKVMSKQGYPGKTTITEDSPPKAPNTV